MEKIDYLLKGNETCEDQKFFNYLKIKEWRYANGEPDSDEEERKKIKAE